jgi:hypothetical protein
VREDLYAIVSRLRQATHDLRAIADDDTADEDERARARFLSDEIDGAIEQSQRVDATASNKTTPASVPATKEKPNMKTMTAAESRRAAEKIATESPNLIAREQARALIGILDRQNPKRRDSEATKRAAQQEVQREQELAELDRKMGIDQPNSLYVQNGANHGMRVMTPEEARAELQRRQAERGGR